MNITISPCPNDTFSFFHWVHHIGLPSHSVVNHLDVQSCNEKALASQGDIIKVSFALYPLVQRDYIILDAGAALGKGCGPLLVGHQNASLEGVRKIAVPGKNTTAYKLLKLFYKGKVEIIYTTYDQIIPMIENKTVDAGVIIHENRFTYKDHQLNLLLDLGKNWEDSYAPLLPLGGIIAKRSLGATTLKEVSAQISKSIAWAFENKQDHDLNQYILKHAQEIDEKVVHQHIDLYVNDYSVDLGAVGRNAIKHLLRTDLQNEAPHFASEL